LRGLAKSGRVRQTRTCALTFSYDGRDAGDGLGAGYPPFILLVPPAAPTIGTAPFRFVLRGSFREG
jgi:hypothetical protein